MEEKTAAMATQFSSLDVPDDKFSTLPEHIIHCILGFLPSIKDLVRTSVISKSWLQARRSFPILDFDLEDFVSHSSSLPGEEIEAKRKQFITFVDSTLQRFGNQSRGGNGDRIKALNLCTVNKMAYLTNRWIVMALDYKVENLALCILMDDSLLPYVMTDRVLSANWLKSLLLVGPTIYIPLTEGSRVDLPSLTSLYIRHSNIPDWQMQKLLSGCPVLESIILSDCESLSKVDIFDHPNLETLEVDVSTTRADLTAISVRAPKLKSFGYRCECLYERNVAVEIHNSPQLKSLRISDRNKTDEWFNKFIAQFPLIENLTVEWCNALRKIRISNPLLENIGIINCINLGNVVINCKKLASLFLLTLISSIPNPSIRMEMDNPPSDCTALILAHMECDVLMNAEWYCKLKEFLTKPFTFKSLKIIVQALFVTDGDMNGEDLHKKLPSAARNIEELRLDVIALPSLHSHFLNGLLSACHPTAIKLDVTSDDSFVKLVCEELGKRENNIDCCCKYGFRCWKHQLKDAKIEKINGIELEENLEW